MGTDGDELGTNFFIFNQIRKPYKIGFGNKTSVRIRKPSPHWQRRGQGFEPPWLHKYDCLAKAFEAFFFVLKPSAVDKSQAV